jgi:hypothetical protein
VPLIVVVARLEKAIAPPLMLMVGAGAVLSTGAITEADARAGPVAELATGAAEAGAATATSAPSATTAGTSTRAARSLTLNWPRAAAILVEAMVFPSRQMVSRHPMYRVGAAPVITVEAPSGAVVQQFVKVWSISAVGGTHWLPELLPSAGPPAASNASRQGQGSAGGQATKPNPRQEAHLVALLKSAEYSTVEIGDLFGVARSTVYRAIGT